VLGQSVRDGSFRLPPELAPVCQMVDVSASGERILSDD